MTGTRSALDPTVFGDSPARDARFQVKDRWVECANYPAGHPRKLVEFLHRQMNEEVNSLEISARALADFPDADWELRMWLARQCADEARHVVLFRNLFEARGGRMGEFPVLNFQYRIVTRIPHLVGRLAVQNRSFEAEGIDAVQSGIEEARKSGDSELASLYESQLADEIVHVRFANEWIRKSVRDDPRNVLRIATALTEATRAFHQVMGEEGTSGIKYARYREGRLEAGFLPEEIAPSGAKQPES
jgi:uncharacterized ferritin-like protein (DUF455 family)